MSEQSEVIFQRLFKSLKVEKAVEEIIDTMLHVLGDMSAEDKMMADKLKAVVLSPDIIGPIFNEYIQLLGERFTPEEAEKIVEWNLSPVGQKWQTSMPQINAELNKRMFEKITPKIQEEIRKIMDEMDGDNGPFQPPT